VNSSILRQHNITVTVHATIQSAGKMHSSLDSHFYALMCIYILSLYMSTTYT